MSAPARGWVALENVVTRDWVALEVMPAMGQTPVEVVRADIHDEVLEALKATRFLEGANAKRRAEIASKAEAAIAKAEVTP